MFPKTLSITVTSATEEMLVEQALAMARDLQHLAGTAPAGQILDRCEEAAVEKGRDFARQALEHTVRQRLEAAQKKGRRSGGVRVDRFANTKGSDQGAC
jgi:hypothetical protein